MPFTVQSAGVQSASLAVGTDLSITVSGTNPNPGSVNRVFAFDFGQGTNVQNFSPAAAQNGQSVAGVRTEGTLSQGSFSTSFTIPAGYLPAATGTYALLTADFPYGAGYTGAWPYNIPPENTLLVPNALTITSGSSSSGSSSSGSTSGQAVQISSVSVSHA